MALRAITLNKKSKCIYSTDVNEENHSALFFFSLALYRHFEFLFTTEQGPPPYKFVELPLSRGWLLSGNFTVGSKTCAAKGSQTAATGASSWVNLCLPSVNSSNVCSVMKQSFYKECEEKHWWKKYNPARRTNEHRKTARKTGRWLRARKTGKQLFSCVRLFSWLNCIVFVCFLGWITFFLSMQCTN